MERIWRASMRSVVVAVLVSTAGIAVPATVQAGSARLIEEFACPSDEVDPWCENPYYTYRLAFADELGERNDLVLSRPKPNAIVVRDATSAITPGEFCEESGRGEVTCIAPLNDPPHEDKIFDTGFVDLGGLDDTATLAGAPLHTVVGGEGDDSIAGDATGTTLKGGPGADTLRGGYGADTLEGGDGSDVLDGGAGRDLVTYAARTAGQPIAVTLDGKRNDGADPNRSGISSTVEEADQDIAIERVAAGAGPDILTGGAAREELLGGAGNDRLDGGPNADILNGGADSDTLSYGGRSADQPVNIRLDGVANDGSDPNRDGVSTLAEEADIDLAIEHATGGAGHDLLRGNAGVNTLKGGFGADRFDGGRGADLFDGGSGSDTVSYAGRPARDPLVIRLDGLRNDGSDPNRSGGSAASEEGDRDISIENAFGGAGPDHLSALLGGRNILGGLGGDDRLFARDGSADVDLVQCGDGLDRFRTDASDSTTACETLVP